MAFDSVEVLDNLLHLFVCCAERLVELDEVGRAGGVDGDGLGQQQGQGQQQNDKGSGSVQAGTSAANPTPCWTPTQDLFVSQHLAPAAALLGCANPLCTTLTCPSEAQLVLYSCGGCGGVRYCSRKCQGQAWELGHGEVCGGLMSGGKAQVR